MPYKDVSKQRAYVAAWKRGNAGAVNAHNAKRHAAKMKRTPEWAELHQIRALYECAARLTKCTGIDWHVDHVLPLQGVEVSGLHVRGNLQVITAAQNLAKNNRWIAEHALHTAP
jgi:5-methylcytosine-specific restriction endonuclease McrA